MDTNKFEELLNNTVVPADLDAEEQLKRVEPLLVYIRESMPVKLYKYRSFCDNHINAFYKDQIWASTAQSMNDGFDARLYFNKEECANLYEQQTSSKRIEAFIKMLKTDA